MATSPDAVYFASRDYAHPARRLGVLVVDSVLLLAIFVAMGFAAGLLYVPKEMRAQPNTIEVQREIAKHMVPLQRPLKRIWLGVCILYHLLTRRLRGGTLGYRLLGVRLVDKQGNTPPMRMLIKRFFLATAFCLPFALSYLHCLKSPRRQAGHDLWSGTWLVRKRARPAGAALTAYHSKLLGTLLLNFIDVEPYVPAASAAVDGRSAGDCGTGVPPVSSPPLEAVPKE